MSSLLLANPDQKEGESSEFGVPEAAIRVCRVVPRYGQIR